MISLENPLREIRSKPRVGARETDRIAVFGIVRSLFVSGLPIIDRHDRLFNRPVVRPEKIDDFVFGPDLLCLDGNFISRTERTDLADRNSVGETLDAAGLIAEIAVHCLDSLPFDGSVIPIKARNGKQRSCYPRRKLVKTTKLYTMICQAELD